MKRWSVCRESRSRKLVFTLALALIWAVVFVGAGARAFAQVQPNGVAPPPGTSWVVTFDDEFTQDYDPNSIQTSYPPYGSLTDSQGNVWTWGTNYGGGNCVPYYQYQNNPPYCQPNQWAILLNGNGIAAGSSMELIGGQVYLSDDYDSYYIWQNGSWVSTSDPSLGVGPVNTGYWNGGAANTDWCAPYSYGRPGGTYMFAEDPNNPCGEFYDGLSLSSWNGLSMESPGGPSAAITTGGPDQYSALFMQHYGFWEASIELPSANDGQSGVANHSDFWMHPIPENNSVGWCPEINVGERPTWEGSLDNTHTSFSVNDWDNGTACDGQGGVFVDAGDANNDDLSAGFHTYGMQWLNDGSPHGTISMYLDGNLVLGPYTLNSNDWNADNGIYMFLSVDNDGVGYAEPFNVQYVRVWQAQ